MGSASWRQRVVAPAGKSRRAGMSPHGHGTPKKATEEEMMEARLDLQFRDNCAHLLIPLNACRKDTFMMPWKCQHERHIYEKCQYLDFKRRTEMLKEQKNA
eukprot:TRINITY_DN1684_c0_g1_i2.p1 TRINITY_DN1684_c0_g1~~TRINITY_DN1684_c0_g1_i2.p1  ORF type:complete len:101 (-),score=20.40 TRINITY_DN1684_c0_g1_i2:68-370(-)